MTRPGVHPRGGRPRIPTWLLALVALAAIGLGAWLFVSGDDDHDDAGRARPTTTSSADDRAESELSLPDSDAAGDSPDDAAGDGVTRTIPDDPESTGEGDDAAGEGDDEELSPAYAALRGHTVTVRTTASCTATAEGEPTELAQGIVDVVAQAGGTATLDAPRRCPSSARSSDDVTVIVGPAQAADTRVLVDSPLSHEIAAALGADAPKPSPTKADAAVLRKLHVAAGPTSDRLSVVLVGTPQLRGDAARASARAIVRAAAIVLAGAN